MQTKDHHWHVPPAPPTPPDVKFSFKASLDGHQSLDAHQPEIEEMNANEAKYIVVWVDGDAYIIVSKFKEE